MIYSDGDETTTLAAKVGSIPVKLHSKSYFDHLGKYIYLFVGFCESTECLFSLVYFFT